MQNNELDNLKTAVITYFSKFDRGDPTVRWRAGNNSIVTTTCTKGINVDCRFGDAIFSGIFGFRKVDFFAVMVNPASPMVATVTEVLPNESRKTAADRLRKEICDSSCQGSGGCIFMHRSV